MNKNVIMGAIAAVLIGAALWLVLGQGASNTEDVSESMDQMQVWVCNACKQDTRMSKQQWLDNIRAGTFACQNCGSTDLMNAVLCPACQKGIPTLSHGALPATCPHCNTSLGEHQIGQPGSESSMPPPG